MKIAEFFERLFTRNWDGYTTKQLKNLYREKFEKKQTAEEAFEKEAIVSAIRKATIIENNGIYRIEYPQYYRGEWIEKTILSKGMLTKKEYDILWQTSSLKVARKMKQQVDGWIARWESNEKFEFGPWNKVE